MPLDKRRWATSEQRQWLSAKFPSYLQAQLQHRYNHFWPTFFQEWFAEYPTAEPCSDDPTDSEHESDADSEQTDSESCPASSKRKAKSNRNPQVGKINIDLCACMSADGSYSTVYSGACSSFDV